VPLPLPPICRNEPPSEPSCEGIAKVPDPPPPPIDCATTPTESGLSVVIEPVLITVTLPAAPPAPAPPTVLFKSPPLIFRAPLKAAAPPPPPTDCANMPTDPAPLTRMDPVLVTFTSPPAPPALPAPPTDDAAPFELYKTPAMLIPPAPPPPPTDCA
jgi:hypothetical protein